MILAEWLEDAKTQRPESPVHQLARIGFPRSDRGKYMLMLEAYFDETGHGDDPNVKYCGMIGVLAPAHKWRRFEKNWQRHRDEAGIEYFHAKEFAHSTDQFADGWKTDEPKRRAFFNKLLVTIAEARPMFFGCVIPMPEYRALEDSTRQALIDPYFLCYQECLRHTLTVAVHKEAIADNIMMVFDDKPKVKKEVWEMYHYLLDREPELAKRVPTPIFRDMRKILPLQAADLIAYEAFKEYERRRERPNARARYGFEWMQSYMRMVTGKTDMVIDFFDKDFLDGLESGFKQGEVSSERLINSIITDNDIFLARRKLT